jgi:hydroxylamine reductase (hybrid-cluster protein)
MALTKAFDTDVNGLPLSFIISWYEQKAVAVLLSLLHLGIKDIHLGPSLPAFVTPNVLDVLVKNTCSNPPVIILSRKENSYQVNIQVMRIFSKLRNMLGRDFRTLQNA